MNDIRICSNCGEEMNAGYVVDEQEYYCSESCVLATYSEEEYLEMYHNDLAYYTEW